MKGLPRYVYWLVAALIIFTVLGVLSNRHGDTYKMITGKDEPTNSPNTSSTQ